VDSLPQGPEPPPAPDATRRIVVASIRPRAIIGVIAIVVAVAAGLWLLWLSKRIITWVLIAMFLAAALNPAVELFQRRLRFRKVPAISLTFLMLIVATGGIALLLVPPLVDAGGQLASDAPGYVDRLARTRLFRELDQRYDVAARLKDFVNTLPDHLGGAGTAVDVAQRLLSGFVGGVTVLVLTFMFLIYGPQLRATSVAALPGHLQDRINAVLDKMYRSVGGYVAGNLLVSLVAGVFAYAALKILGVPAAAALAFWVGIADLVPLVGATVGAIPAVTVAFFSGGWLVGVIVIVYFVVYQQVENHFVQPLVMRRTTSLNPLLTLIAVVLGAELLGIIGALLAIPAASMIKIVATDLWEHRRGAATDAAPDEPPQTDAPAAT
jgi:predicted PurR-regulated permease PerM